MIVGGWSCGGQRGGMWRLWGMGLRRWCGRGRGGLELGLWSRGGRDRMDSGYMESVVCG